MFNQYTYKQKFQALLVLFILLGSAAYKRSFSSLFSVYSEYYKLHTKYSDFEQKNKNLPKLQNDIYKLDKVLGKGNVAKEVIQQEIIKFISTKSQKVSIVKLEPIHDFEDENLRIISNQIIVSGNINDLLELTYSLEKDFAFSRIVSYKFFTIKKNNQAVGLQLQIIFQNYENIS